MTTITASDERVRSLQALASILEFARTSAEEVGDRSLVQAIIDAKNIATLSQRREVGLKLVVSETGE